MNTTPRHYDVLVAGTGAAGLTAALRAATDGARVLIIDSAPAIGGTTALGGGRVWIPANWTKENSGDTPELAIEYMMQTFDSPDPEMITTFQDRVNDMAHFVTDHSPHRWAVCPNYPDYHPDLKGATYGGRCFDMEPLPLSSLVPDARNTLLPNGYLPINHADWEAWRYPKNFDFDLIDKRKKDGIITGGPALCAALADGALRAGAELELKTALADVRLNDAKTHVTGAVIRTPQGDEEISVGAVILATGGYDSSPTLKDKFLPKPLGRSASTPTNTGVAVEVSENLGLPVENMGQGWWMPHIQVSGEEILGSSHPRPLIRERGVPHQMIVNRAGQRFADEAAPYNEFGKALHRQAADGSYPNQEAWMIFDENFRQKYTLPGLTPSGDLPPHFTQGATLAELADKLGIDPDGLAATQARFNTFCEKGVDEDFGRGGDPYDHYYGDPWKEGNRCLGPVEKGPFYAVKVISASIGSKGGPKTNTNAEVLDADGNVVGGLYAVGNASAFWTSDGYPGPGATLGVGMTYAYIAGGHAAAALV
jgi:3-oxosteroid 1-dehydrogenase